MRRSMTIRDITKKAVLGCVAAALIPGAASAASISWEVNVKASTSTKARNNIYIGQKAEATDGYDAKYDGDAWLEGDIKAYISHPEWARNKAEYWRDIMGPEEGGKSWNIAVESALAGDAITLSWKSKKLAGFSATLMDNSTNETVDMTTSDSYSYTNNGTREFTVAVTAPVSIPKTRPNRASVGFQKFESGAPVELKLGSGTDGEGYALTYNVEVYSDRQLNEMVGSATGLTDEAGDVAWNAGALADGVYFYRVDVYNGFDYSGWSNTRALRVGGASNNGRSDKALGGKRF